MMTVPLAFLYYLFPKYRCHQVGYIIRTHDEVCWIVVDPEGCIAVADCIERHSGIRQRFDRRLWYIRISIERCGLYIRIRMAFENNLTHFFAKLVISANFLE